MVESTTYKGILLRRIDILGQFAGKGSPTLSALPKSMTSQLSVSTMPNGMNRSTPPDVHELVLRKNDAPSTLGVASPDRVISKPEPFDML